MKKLSVLVVCFLMVSLASAKKGAYDGLNLFEFNHMTAVVLPFTGAANPIRGIGGAGAPWQIASGNVEMKSTGKIELSVRGLVLVANGTNPIPTFAVIEIGQSKDAAGARTVVNLVAGTTSATATGDADFEGSVTPPSPCIAPIVFVAIPATATAPARWLAISGF